MDELKARINDAAEAAAIDIFEQVMRRRRWAYPDLEALTTSLLRWAQEAREIEMHHRQQQRERAAKYREKLQQARQSDGHL